MSETFFKTVATDGMGTTPSLQIDPLRLQYVGLEGEPLIAEQLRLLSDPEVFELMAEPATDN